MRFSERIGLVKPNMIQIKNIDDKLRNRIINCFDQYLKEDYEGKFLLDALGKRWHYDYNNSYFKEYLKKCVWYEIYDSIENYIIFLINKSDNEVGIIKKQTLKKFSSFCKTINYILEEEKSGYRIINGMITAITDEQEIKSIEESINTEFDSVNTHLTKALQLYSDREAPDYENSIKESISAVEAMCCVINGKNDSLGKALKNLENNGIKIHSSMKIAFEKLYGYTSDADGIRHGGKDFTNVNEEEAKYMLISCSAFVNYLKVKYSKIGGQQ